MKNLICVLTAFFVTTFYSDNDKNDFKIIGKRVGFIEIGTDLKPVKERLISEGYSYEFDESYGHLFSKNGEGLAISTYPQNKQNIIRGIWVHDKRYKTKFNIGIGTDISVLKNLKDCSEPQVSDGEGMLMINVNNDVFEIDKRLKLTLFLSDGRKYHDYNDSIYSLSGKPTLSGKEKVIEILLNDPLGEYDEFIK